jgi:hypothetical protein
MPFDLASLSGIVAKYLVKAAWTSDAASGTSFFSAVPAATAAAASFDVSGTVGSCA